MKNKLLNIIFAVAVILAAAAVIYTKGICMKNDLGYFPQNALHNAPARVNDAIDVARARASELAAMPDKTYMNFVRALADNDAKLTELLMPIYHLDSVMNSDETKQIMNEIIPPLSAYGSDMARHRGIYEGFKYIRDNEFDALNAAQQKLVTDVIRAFEIAGVNLPADKQARLKEIAAEMSKMSNDFSNNVIEANKNFKLKIMDETKLGDMPTADRATARIDDWWEFSLLDSHYVAVMTFVTDRDLRKQTHDARMARAPENMDIITHMLSLRVERAGILGYETHADLVFEDRSAPSPAAVKTFLKDLRNRAAASAKQDRAELAARAATDGIKDFAPHDAAFYGRLVRTEQYDLDESVVREYFETGRTTDAIFDMLAEMFDIKFTERKVPLWHPDAKYYDMSRDGKIIAGFFIDLPTRETKSPGAWMNSFRPHYVDANGVRHLPKVLNVGNFPAATKDTPSLMATKDVATLFHEIGHGLHGLLSAVDELDLSGTAVDRDVVEFPSSFLEYFWNSPVTLKRIARHYKTGEPMPDELIEKIIKSDRFMRGTEMVWKTEYSLFDMEIHTQGKMTAQQIRSAFDTARPADSITPGPSYDRPLTAFMHPFAHSYSAGYYSYLWAEQMAADAYIAANGNPFDKDLMHRYRDTVLAMGGTKKMDEIYREFMGRDPKPDSLLKFYGLK
ncbi:MAG: M3 family metallopeptidase [Alphaproteobacteria bacterium]|nr:M3 family metallopeptidase [Alphaproteobacteria bacterium]MCL2889683.1 M3 family metallopeptidase [Alphaproteobacteria bacterium]